MECGDTWPSVEGPPKEEEARTRERFVRFAKEVKGTRKVRDSENTGMPSSQQQEGFGNHHTVFRPIPER